MLSLSSLKFSLLILLMTKLHLHCFHFPTLPPALFVPLLHPLYLFSFSSLPLPFPPSLPLSFSLSLSPSLSPSSFSPPLSLLAILSLAFSISPFLPTCPTQNLLFKHCKTSCYRKSLLDPQKPIFQEQFFL